MSTIGQLIDRIDRTFLNAPGDRDVTLMLNGGINDAVTSLVIVAPSTPEDEYAMTAGVVIEI